MTDHQIAVAFSEEINRQFQMEWTPDSESRAGCEYILIRALEEKARQFTPEQITLARAKEIIRQLVEAHRQCVYPMDSIPDLKQFME